MSLSADITDNLFSLVQRHSPHFCLRCLRGRNGIVHVGKNSMFTARGFRNLHLRHDFLYDILYQILVYKHALTSYSGSASPRLRPCISRILPVPCAETLMIPGHFLRLMLFLFQSRISPSYVPCTGRILSVPNTGPFMIPGALLRADAVFYSSSASAVIKFRKRICRRLPGLCPARRSRR